MINAVAPNQSQSLRDREFLNHNLGDFYFKAVFNQHYAFFIEFLSVKLPKESF